jgi:hypothetical protein
MEALLEAREVEEGRKKKRDKKEKMLGTSDATCVPIIDSVESLINK